MPICFMSISLKCICHLLKLTPTYYLKLCQGQILFRKAQFVVRNVWNLMKTTNLCQFLQMVVEPFQCVFLGIKPSTIITSFTNLPHFFHHKIIKLWFLFRILILFVVDTFKQGCQPIFNIVWSVLNPNFGRNTQQTSFTRLSPIPHCIEKCTFYFLRRE